MAKQFLAVGDYLINPELLTYAVLEQGTVEPRLRLGFANCGADHEGDLWLTGDVAREVLRWLRLNATFLSTAAHSDRAAICPDHRMRLIHEASATTKAERLTRTGDRKARRGRRDARFLSRVGDRS